jgi:chemotaxis protein CheZ
MTVDNSMNALIVDDYKATLLTQELAPNLATQLQNVTLRIHKACSFQDITRQRISKVVNALNTIEQKVLITLATFGPRSRNPTNLTNPHGEGLLNGCQLPESVMQQNEIDAPLASFD